MSAYKRLLLACFSLSILCSAWAHPHHDELTEEQRNAPVDAILWIHMFLQASVWGILFPIGMVLGITRSRWHVPLQATGFALTIGGYFLGHAHKGRMFLKSAHGVFANILIWFIAAQLFLGIYLKLHIHEKSIRPYAVVAHGILGKGYPILGWTQMLFGAMAFRGYCRGGHLGQCLAHYIMGSGFIAYGIIMVILLLVGENWLRRKGRSPEWFDSWVIMLWGIVNTFTEHHGGDWSVKDMQHTILGVLWWAGGLLGIFLARNNQRNVVPGVIIILTGWAMSEHAQALMFSTKVHAIFGETLMLAGATRIIEICFFAPSLKADIDDDNNSDHTLAGLKASEVTAENKSAAAKAFRHLPPFLLVSAGLLFMSATDEELRFVHGQEMDHVTYVLIMFSIAFFLYAFVNFLLHLYCTTGRNSPERRAQNAGPIELMPTPRDPPGNSWYSRVPNGDRSEPAHVIGDEED